MSEITTKPAIGSMRLGSLFLTLPTRMITGQQIISSEGGKGEQRLEAAAVRRLFAEPQWPYIGLQHHGHAVVELGTQFVRKANCLRSRVNFRSFARSASVIDRSL